MKRIGTLVVLGLILSLSASAQYKVNKQKYNPKEYQRQAGDPYNPVVAGVASYFLPGLGQMVSGEVGRGLGFLGGYIGAYIMILAGGKIIYNTANGDAFSMVLFGVAGILGLKIWSIVDAVKVAKVNNMVLREAASRIKLQPYVSNVTNSNQLSTGLTFQISLN